MTTLPLLRLPALVFDKIYDHLDAPEIILLSQLSKRLNNLVRTHETPRRGRTLRVALYNNSAVVTLITSGKSFTWTLGHTMDKFMELIIEGRTWRVTSNSSTQGWMSHPGPGFLEADLLSLVRFFKSLFKCPIIAMNLAFGSIESIDKLIVQASDLHVARNISVSTWFLDKRQMDFMLDHFVSETLCISGCPGEDYKYQGTLNFKNIELSGATWIDLEMLEKMSRTCKRICFDSASPFTNGDFNQFIKNWMAGENRSLETVTFTWPQSFTGGAAYNPIRLPAIMKEIPYAPGAKKRPNAAEYFESRYKYEKGVDIRRSSDGLMATVLVVRDGFIEEFVFTVWYDKEPNLLSCS